MLFNQESDNEVQPVAYSYHPYMYLALEGACKYIIEGGGEKCKTDNAGLSIERRNMNPVKILKQYNE